MSRWTTVTVETDVDVDLSEIDDDDIKDEYESRFGRHLKISWLELYELRRSNVDKFLSVIDNIIMDKTGRIL